jgi:ferredoxin-NADP reductase
MGSPDFDLPFESVRGLLLDLARERALNPLLDLVVQRLAEHPDVALARVWLVGEGDICPTCPMRDECLQRVPCLHLAASVGRIDGALLDDLLPSLEVDFYLCGPIGLMATLQTQLEARGVPSNQIYTESFGPVS